MFVSRLFIRAVKRQALPVLDPRHQLDSQEIGQSADRFALPMTAGVNYVGLSLAIVLHQAVDNLDRFGNAAGNKVRNQRDVFSADHKVRDPAITTVTNMIFAQQVAVHTGPISFRPPRPARLIPSTRAEGSG